MTDAPCYFVIERATEGPCATCSGAYTYGLHFPGDRRASGHPYLGPVLKRCGHEEGEHFWDERGPSGELFQPRCGVCGDWHAYTTQ